MKRSTSNKQTLKKLFDHRGLTAIVLGIAVGLLVIVLLTVILEWIPKVTTEMGVVVAVNQDTDQLVVKTWDGDEYTVPLSSYKSGQEQLMANDYLPGQEIEIKLNKTREQTVVQELFLDPDKLQSILITSLVPNQVVPIEFVIVGTVPNQGKVVLKLINERTSESLIETETEAFEESSDRWQFSIPITLSELVLDLKDADKLRLDIKQESQDAPDETSRTLPLIFRSQAQNVRARAYFISKEDLESGLCQPRSQQQVDLEANQYLSQMINLLSRTETYQGKELDVVTLVPSGLEITSVKTDDEQIKISLSQTSLPEFNSACEVQAFLLQLQRSFDSLGDSYSVTIQVDGDPMFFKSLQDNFDRSER